MEKLLHYCWKHRLFDLLHLQTVEGSSLEVLDVGLQNFNDGPDFFNAKIRIDGLLHIGNVEIHDKASDWYAHHHESDVRYNNVILHVCSRVDKIVVTESGFAPPQVEISIPKFLSDNYQQLLQEDKYPPCYKIIPDISRIVLHSWMNALQAERLEQKTNSIITKIQQNRGSWEETFFATLARNFGFGVNGDAFEQWSSMLNLKAAAHHRDNLFQVEAIFLGQAGFLNLDAMPSRFKMSCCKDDYFMRLKKEFEYLSLKFGLETMDGRLWRFLRLRPQNFPYIRISQLVNLYCREEVSLRTICECDSLRQVEQLLRTQTTLYWDSHYRFGCESPTKTKRLSATSLHLLSINTVVPLLFAYGRYYANEDYCNRALRFLEELSAEENNVVRMWRSCGLSVKCAADSQALIQLKRQYCDRRDCLRCRIGYEYLRSSQKQKNQ